MKKCTTCGVPKPLNDFYKKSGQISTGLTGSCKLCIKIRQKEYRHNRQDLINKKQKEKLRVLKQELVDYMGGCCKICGVVDTQCIYDFHHTDPSHKEFTIGDNRKLSVDSVKDELDKCIMVCSNCHRKIHWSK